ncbi:thiamine phosphate synthase [Leuconostoc koreense]|nr:thiamine phosphate synthase [Leuconostoc mesenteroides]QGM25337.1 thiamine phosphate synthase [Leuconostoc mesenteroides subsp. mesenteroides]
MFDPSILVNYLVLGTQDTNGERHFFEVLEEALQSKISVFQYREKGRLALTGAEKLRVAKKVRQLTADYHVPLIIDDDIQLAHEIGAEGVHFGQKDGDIINNIQLAGSLAVGVSVSNSSQYQRIENIRGIDYIGIGPIFATVSKSDANPEVGIAGLQYLTSKSKWPSVAIGGISETNLPSVLSTGVNGAAVISMISQSSNISATLKYWRSLY